MSLSINPFTKLVGQASSSISQATNALNASTPTIPSEATAISSAKLDGAISQIGAGLQSGFNGITAGVKQVTTALGNIGSQASSTVSGAISSLQSSAGSISNITADISGSLNKLTGGNLGSGIQSAAGAISGAAGMVNNVLSLFRASNLPKGGELFIKQGSPITLSSSQKNDWRVRINTDWSAFPGNALFKELEATNGVVWPYLPNITVSTKANYSSPDVVHSNYQFFAYKNSVVDDITITGDFTCETETDAAYWIAATTFFKTATKMFFGASTYAGNPPIICRLSGYGSSIFNEIPVIIKSFQVELKEDVNYVRCNLFGTNTWVPVLSSITVIVAPIYNRANLRKFSLQQYAQGKMTGDSGVGYL
jgi:hypothetical protein